MGAIADPTLTLVRRNEVRPDCTPNVRFRPEQNFRFRQSLQKSRMLSKFFMYYVCAVLLFEFVYLLSVLMYIVVYLHVTVMLIACSSLAC